jgi:hypothetical protein
MLNSIKSSNWFFAYPPKPAFISITLRTLDQLIANSLRYTCETRSFQLLVSESIFSWENWVDELLDVVECLMLSLSGQEMGQLFPPPELEAAGMRQPSRGAYLKKKNETINIYGISKDHAINAFQTHRTSSHDTRLLRSNKSYVT